MSTLPGWTIHVPGHADEAEIALRHAHRSGASHYIRLTNDSNAAPVLEPTKLTTLRRGSDSAPTVLAIGPMADAVVAATVDLDVTVLYTSVVRPIDARSLSAAVIGETIAIVEPTLAGTTVGEVAAALNHRPMRIVGIGVQDPELMHYGSPDELRAAHGLDVAGIRRQIERLALARAG